MAIDGRGLGGGNLPVLAEAAEVVETDNVGLGQRPAHAAHPPIVATALQFIPAVERIAPALSSRREGVRWNAGDAFRFEAFAVEAEELRMGPDISRIVADKDGDITDQTDGAAAAVAVQRAPLLEEGELKKAAALELFGQHFTDGSQRCRIAMGERGGPAVPALLLITQAEGEEEYVVFQPPLIFADEALEAAARFAGGFGEEAAGSLVEQWQLFSLDAREIDRAVAVVERIQAPAREQTTLSEPLQADEPRIAGKGRVG